MHLSIFCPFGLETRFDVPWHSAVYAAVESAPKVVSGYYVIELLKSGLDSIESLGAKSYVCKCEAQRSVAEVKVFLKKLSCYPERMTRDNYQSPANRAKWSAACWEFAGGGLCVLPPGDRLRWMGRSQNYVAADMVHIALIVPAVPDTSSLPVVRGETNSNLSREY